LKENGIDLICRMEWNYLIEVPLHYIRYQDIIHLKMMYRNHELFTTFIYRDGFKVRRTPV